MRYKGTHWRVSRLYAKGTVHMLELVKVELGMHAKVPHSIVTGVAMCFTTRDQSDAAFPIKRNGRERPKQ